jgi:class 3 adenylate cyclase
MPAVASGCLVLADISGYTEYLGGVELEHCHDVLAKLMAAVAEQVRGALQVAKFEGDAIFCYDPHDRCDGEMLLATIDACYFAFARLRRDIEVNLTCPCDACRRVPGLDLKLIAHHGSFVEQRIGDSPELVGSDVVVAHRLLKNSVTDRTGLRGYALLSDACAQRLGLDVAALGLTEHRDSYESLGEVVCWIRDLEARWHEEQERAAVVVTAEDSDVTVTRDFPVPPAVLWEYCTSPQKKVLWRIADKRIEMRGGRPRGASARSRIA